MKRIVFLERSTFNTFNVREGKWQNARQFCLLDHTIHDLHGSKIGIIGYGSLGKAVAALAESIGMRVLIAERKHATNTRHGRAEFGKVLRQSDVLSLHCPLTEETRNLI
ncbi:MAG: NAD(P)-dependent oxidoreductase, partial [Pyrinomonadaceae bacterium]